MGEVFREFLNLFRGDESPIRKIIKFIVILALITLIVVVLESAMGLVTIGRLERQVNLLKELNALTATGLGSHNQLVHLENIFNKAVGELEMYNPNLLHIVQSTLPVTNPVTWVEIVTGASSWIVIGIFTLKTTKGGILQKLTGCGIMTIFGFAISYVIAQLITSPNSLVAIPLSFLCGVTTLIVLVIVASAISPQKQTQATEPEGPGNPKS